MNSVRLYQRSIITSKINFDRFYTSIFQPQKISTIYSWYMDSYEKCPLPQFCGTVTMSLIIDIDI